jgi:hypothetical protein
LMFRADDLASQERAALVAWHLAHGDAFRTREAAQMTGLSHSGALKLMCRLSRILPICQDNLGFWQVLAMREAD